jgi:hypothetical protein
MVHVVTACVLALGVLVASPSWALDFYVDSQSGSDAATGFSPGTAWRSLRKVNAGVFRPGDRILFASGRAWTGQLWPKGSGTAAYPIQIDRYGSGPLPIIDGGGVANHPPTLWHGGAVNLLNQSYWEIRNLEVKNCPSPCGINTTRYQSVGIMVRNSTGGPLQHIVIGNNVVHDVPAQVDGYYGANAGIAVVSDTNGSYWGDVTIENNDVYTVDRIGVFVGPSWQDGVPANVFLGLPKTTGITIRNNTINDSGGDGILNYVTYDTLVEGNTVSNCGSRTTGGSVGIWTADSDTTVFQYNEVYGEQPGQDRYAFDADWGSVSALFQYNYSHDNYGGFLLTWEAYPNLTSILVDNLQARFNVSSNDGSAGTGVFTFCGKTLPAGANPPDINNNTVYLGPQMASDVFRQCDGLCLAGTMYVYDNVFASFGLPPAHEASFPGAPEAVFDYNLYWGTFTNTPFEPNGLYADPLFDPTSVNHGIGRFSVNGLMLRAGSPALSSGYDSGYLGPLDYWGNAVSSPPNRGAYAGPGL